MPRRLSLEEKGGMGGAVDIARGPAYVWSGLPNCGRTVSLVSGSVTSTCSWCKGKDNLSGSTVRICISGSRGIGKVDGSEAGVGVGPDGATAASCTIGVPGGAGGMGGSGGAWSIASTSPVE